MSRSDNLKVQSTEFNQPGFIEVKAQWLKIENILESWYDTGSWWEGESEKVFYRLYCQDGGIREIFKDLSSGQWFLYRVYD